ncbi:MAG: Gfo/Idh/MocA family oxidoreductase [Gemmataceae bacterium]|nr:Gfo/Idh/MocA family oxidoreductase [Gemmataceae bacterium]MDW8265249.1 Gfo/Idh/MocA family oxidoreductase [Gemmataceae bacterium]
MVRIGIVGIGFMGMIHYLASRRLKGAKVTAICSRDPKKLAGDWRGIRGNFGPPGQVMDLGHVKRYSQLDDLLADPAIDLVDICNPTHLHPATAIAALKAGKHVLVEKAIALETKDADAMLKAAAAARRKLMVAHVLPFVPEFAYAAEVIRSRAFGALQAAHFRRIISRPDWSADIADVSKTGGPAIDLHIHDTHFIGLVCGVPAKVFSTGVLENNAVAYLTTQYLYGPGGPCVSCSSGALAMKGRMFTHGFEIFLEKATLVFESGATPLTVLTADGKQKRPRLKGGDDPVNAFTAEIQTAVDDISHDREPDLLSGKLARDALALCHKECQSLRTGKAVSL